MDVAAAFGMLFGRWIRPESDFRKIKCPTPNDDTKMMGWGAGEGQEWCRRVGLDRPADSIILAVTGIGANRG